MITCQKCNHANIDGAIYCGNCGAELLPKIVCKNCGQPNDASQKFCNFCGSILTDGVICPKCGQQNVTGAKYCSKCGFDLVNKADHIDINKATLIEEPSYKATAETSANILICPACGFVNEKGTSICVNCNKPLVVPASSDVVQKDAQGSPGGLATTAQAAQQAAAAQPIAMQYIICPKCGYANELSFRNCVKCGSLLKVSNVEKQVESAESPRNFKVCPNCYRRVNSDANHCRYCGYGFSNYVHQPQRTNRVFSLSRGTGCFILILFILIAIGGVLYKTNPSADAHNQAIVADLSATAGSYGEYYGGSLGGTIARLLGEYVGSEINLFDYPSFRYQNYYLFSATMFGDKIISYGILGDVRIVTPASDWANDLLGNLPTDIENIFNWP